MVLLLHLAPLFEDCFEIHDQYFVVRNVSIMLDCHRTLRCVFKLLLMVSFYNFVKKLFSCWYCYEKCVLRNYFECKLLNLFVTVK